MRYGILGPLEVIDSSGRRVELGTPRQRAVLAILVVHANRVVSLDRLIDELWGDAPPSAATASLQAYISNLRKVLEPTRVARAKATVLVSEPPGYVLRCEPEAVDAVAFELQCTEAQVSLPTDPARARLELEQALARWRGPALADFAYETFASAEVARLEEMRAAAEEDLVDARLATGDVGLAVAELERLVAQEPLRERRRAQQMLAYYRAGRQADALRAYEEMRVEFARELGAEPSPELVRLQQQILDHEPDLGAPAPVPVPVAAERIPARAADSDDEAPATGARAPFVGRETELAQLLGIARDPHAPRTRLAVITGTAGIGKTRLVEELVADARARGGLVAWGRCHDDEGAPPLWPWVQSLRPVLASGAAALSETERSDLAALLPELGRPAAETDDADAARFRQFDTVTRVLERVAANVPVLVVLDDLHWADASSLRLLRFVATYANAPRAMLVVTAREHEGERPEAVMDAIGDLARQPGCVRLALGPLAPAAVDEYVRETARDVPADVVASLHARTEGNPFFMCELVKLLVSEAPQRDAMGEIPAAIGDVVRRRVARLPTATQSLLQVAAVSGREFDIDLVASVCDRDIDAALDDLDPALVTGVVGESDAGAFRFAHALLSETLEAGLTAVARARVHLQLAHAIVDRSHDVDPHLSDIGWHLDGAGSLADPEEVVMYAARAAEVATRQLAYDEAVIARERVRTAVERMPAADPRTRLDALVGVGVARLRAGDLGGARALQTEMLELAETLDDVDTLAHTALAYQSLAATQWRSWGVVSQPMVAALERVIAELPPGDSELRARALCAHGVELYYDEARRA
ncbi:MAG: BTAD domain-containing putative transcriptional regulator, partial [Acidimicrobiia bacterium]